MLIQQMHLNADTTAYITAMYRTVHVRSNTACRPELNILVTPVHKLVSFTPPSPYPARSFSSVHWLDPTVGLDALERRKFCCDLRTSNHVPPAAGTHCSHFATAAVDTSILKCLYFPVGEMFTLFSVRPTAGSVVMGTVAWDKDGKSV
jgi:hypothetical protein